MGAYPTLPPYDPSAYPPPHPVADEPILPEISGPPQPYGIPDLPPSAQATPFAAGANAGPAAPDSQWYEPESYRSPPPSPTSKWLIGIGVGLLAIIAVTMAGLALIKRTSGHNSAGTPPTSSSRATTEQGTSARSTAAQRPVRTAAVTGTPSGTTYQVSIWAEETDKNCHAHAHGNAVLAFLAKHPCTSMTRRLGTTTVDDKSVGFALTSIRFPSGTRAAAFRALVTKDGTGNLDDLLADGKRLPAGPRSLPAPDGFSCVSHDATVLVMDSWYLTGATPENDPPLTALANDFFGRDGIG